MKLGLSLLRLPIERIPWHPAGEKILSDSQQKAYDDLQNHSFSPLQQADHLLARCWTAGTREENRQIVSRLFGGNEEDTETFLNMAIASRLICPNFPPSEKQAKKLSDENIHKLTLYLRQRNYLIIKHRDPMLRELVTECQKTVDGHHYDKYSFRLLMDATGEFIKHTYRPKITDLSKEAGIRDLCMRLPNAHLVDGLKFGLEETPSFFLAWRTHTYIVPAFFCATFLKIPDHYLAALRVARNFTPYKLMFYVQLLYYIDMATAQLEQAQNPKAVGFEGYCENARLSIPECDKMMSVLMDDNQKVRFLFCSNEVFSAVLEYIYGKAWQKI